MQNAFRLGDWLVQPQRSIIERGDESVHLKPKSMAVLKCLAVAGGEVVSRDQLFDTVWPGGVVSDDTLTQCVVELRKAFGDSAHEAQIIETIPKMGFRLVPPVVPLDSETKHSGKKTTSRAIAVAICATLILGVLYWYQTSSLSRNPIIEIEDVKSIAVLPFVDMSPDEDQEYFADGLSEELTNRLGRLSDLRVTGRTSSFYFKDKDVDL
jgi:transcriptional activator of cad operon